MKEKQYSINIGNKEFMVEFPDWAEQANGSCLVRLGDTVVLAVATMSTYSNESLDYFPLFIDYEEKFYAAGMILGSRFVRRETRPSQEAILVARLIDRTTRPLFDDHMRNEVQIVVTALSIDGENDPDVPAILASSLALGTSDIPWSGPISGVRIAKVNDELMVNPAYKEREQSSFEIVSCGLEGTTNMIEVDAHEVPAPELLGGFKKAVEENDRLLDFQKKIIAEVGKEKAKISFEELDEKTLDLFNKTIRKDLEAALYEKDKVMRNKKITEVYMKWRELVKAEELSETSMSEVFANAQHEILHQKVLNEGKRPDGRKFDELRELKAQVSILPRTHGSALFYRGQTHTLSTVTLGSPKSTLLIEGMETREEKRFMHHYNFPPFSSGEVGRMRGPGRREIGHGALAEKALLPVVPTQKEFPYTIRVVSETLSSNGSTSMAAATASCMALMDAGVPIKAPVAGIAIGMMSEGKAGEKYKILTDIQGPEDGYGDMDCKVAGTASGVTAMQMDVKVEGITVGQLEEVIEQSYKAIRHILDFVGKEISKPREKLSPYAPKIIQMQINPERIGDVIGPGGRIINDIIARTNTEIDIEQDGSVYITGATEESVGKAKKIVEELIHEFTVGERFDGTVTRLFDFGAMVEILPGHEGLVHISQIAPFRINRVEDMLSVGDKVPVEVIEIDDQGRVNLSIKKVKALEIKPGASADSAPRHKPRGFSRGDRRGGPRQHR